MACAATEIALWSLPSFAISYTTSASEEKGSVAMAKAALHQKFINKCCPVELAK